MSENRDVTAGTIVEDTVVPAREPWSRVVRKGQMMRIVDLEGKQAVDFLCYNADDPEDRYCAADTMKIGGSLFLAKGTVLYTDRDHALFTITEDTCGFHDTIGGCCSDEINITRYAAPGPAQLPRQLPHRTHQAWPRQEGHCRQR